MNKFADDPFKSTFDSLEELAELISEVLKCPITIEDVNHRLLAYSTHDDCTDPARISTIIGRKVPEKVINQMWKEGIIPELLNTDQPIRVKSMDDIGLGNRVAISIWKQEEVLGFIWALEVEKTLSEQELMLLKKAADSAKNKLLQLQTRRNRKEERFQEFFWKLLTGHMKDHEEIMEHFHSLNIPVPPTYAVLVFQFQENISGKEDQQISYLLKTSQSIKILLSTTDCNQLILLLSPAAGPNPFHELEQFVETFLMKMEERYGIRSIMPVFSSIYSDYQQIAAAYQETLSVLSIKKRFPEETKNIYNYHKLGIYQLINFLLEKRKNEPYVNQALKNLHDYDRKHNSSLVETLEVFLNKDNNINDTARELNIHANTLNYRLKRISEIGDINLKDPNQKIILYLDLKLEKLQTN